MTKSIIRSKILHLQLTDPLGGDYTLLTDFIDGSIKYMLYDGHSSYGTKFPLSQLGMPKGVYLPVETKYKFPLSQLGMPKGVYLPVETKYEDETMEEFRDRVIDCVREHSRMVIVRIVENQVKFYQP